MSGHYHDSDCVPSAQERTAEALERVADTLDDYMDMTLALQAVARRLVDEPERALAAIADELASIAARRKERETWRQR